MNKNSIIALSSLLVVIIGAFTLGYSVARIKIVPISAEKTVTKYIKGETVTDTAYIQIPYFIKSPAIVEYIEVYKVDSIGNTTNILDTLKSLENTVFDWNVERKYKSVLFDDQNGKLEYDISVKKNKLSNFAYQFTPLQKVTTKTKERIFQPFLSASYSTLGYVGVGGGVFYKNVGFEYQHQIGISNNAHLFGVKYKL